MLDRRTYREANGERVEGTWRHVFINNGGRYFLTDLLIYADGQIDCWGSTDLDGFRERLRTGWVATQLPEGARASAHDLGSWRFAEPRSWIDADGLFGEVVDEVSQLNGRPDSSDRCHEAIERYRQEPTEQHRRAIRTAYDAIPRHLRSFLLGDQDRKDGPVRILITDIGQQLDGDGPVVTQQMHRKALDYFQRRDDLREEDAPKPIAAPAQAAKTPSIVIEQRFLRLGWPDEPGVHVLRNEFPSPILVNGVEFPTVTHAYWSLSTTDADLAERICVTDKPQDAHRIGEEAPRRANWPVTRVALMHTLLREKFTQHPPNADVLIATGDSELRYTDTTESFSTTPRGTGRDWIGRLLELVRSELVAHREGLL